MAGTMRKRARDTWELRVELGRDPKTHKRRFRYMTVRGTKRDAERALTEALHRRDTGIDLEPTKVTVGEYLERWLQDYATVKVAPATYERYRQIVKRLDTLLGSVKLQSLRPTQIQEAYSTLLKDGLTARTVLHHHRVLRNALQQAMRWQLLARNPADAATPPRPERSEMRVLDATEVHRLLDACEDEQVRTVIYVAVTTGMRIGELLGLRWSDLDLVRGTAHVVRAAQYLPKTGIMFRTPKTSRSRRSIALSEETVRMLRAHRARQIEARMALETAYDDGGLVFASLEGSPLPQYWVRRPYQRALQRAGLESIRFHDLRHTAATLMLQAGVHPKIVSERLGHAAVSITLDTYSHVLPDMQREAAAALDAVLAAGR